MMATLTAKDTYAAYEIWVPKRGLMQGLPGRLQSASRILR